MAEERCPECKSKKLTQDYEKGELVCGVCGLVITEGMMDEGPEWRAFNADQRRERARGGAPITYMRPNKGLVTEIDQYNRDIRGARLPSKRQAQFYRMRRWHKRASITGSTERNLAVALSELNRIASYLGLPDSIRESAALTYRKCVEKGLIKGRLIESIVAAVIYAKCRERGVPRTLAEIANVSGVKKKEIGRAYRNISRELDLKIPLADPSYYVPRFVAGLGLSGKVQEKAFELMKKATKKRLISGRGPTGLAAAAVYTASVLCNEQRTQKEVADAAGITEVTIRNRYKELKTELDLPLE
ncbi:MAG: transcription initiation factor IIB [Candidatus Micrarchaeota archaeon]|nr:transcription initiation factor IIB [Candidatus Micrarchaeota archaeon]